MRDFEEELRNVLHRKAPPYGFAERVFERAGRGHIPVQTVWRHAAAVGLAASLLLGSVGIRFEAERRERAEGQAAKAKLMQALQITASKLQQVQQKVRELEK